MPAHKPQGAINQEMQACRDAGCHTQAERLRIAIDMLGEPAFPDGQHLLWCRRGFLTAAGTFSADATDGHQFVDQGIAADRYRVLIDVIPDLQLRTEAFRYDHHQGTWGWATGPTA